MNETPVDAARQLWRLWEQGEQPELAKFLAQAGPLEPLALAAVLRVDQRQRWQLGQRIPAEHYLRFYPAVAADEEAALDIIYAEFLLRQERGEPVSPAEFLERLPQYAGPLRLQLDFGQALLSPQAPAATPPAVDEICTRFQAAWQAGQRPLIEDYLCEAPLAVRPQLLPRLIKVEITCRHEKQEVLQPLEYQLRFPHLDPQWIALEIAGVLSTRGSGPSPNEATPRPESPPPPPGRGRPTLRAPGRQFRCPHCHSPMQLSDRQLDRVLCPGCGSSFRVGDAEMTTSPPSLSLGKFQLLELVGQGTFGDVWRSRDTELGRIVAIKLPRQGLAISPQEMRRFLDEARKVARLRHPCIVAVHEVLTVAGLPAIVSDFIQGVPLKDLLDPANPRLPLPQAATLVAEIAEALHYAHTQGLVHRDIKPANIMVESAPPTGDTPASARGLGKPLILDFGLALYEEATTGATVEGQIIGTPAYMSPEQAAGRGHRADRRSDVFSLGICLYQLICGELPFRGSRAMLLHQIQFEEPQPPRRIQDRIPRDLETICLKAMAKEPGRRYQTAAEFGADLRRFLKGDAILARPVGRLERSWRWCRRHPREATLAGAVVGLLVLLAGGSLLAAAWIARERDAATAANLKACSAVEQMLTEVGQDQLADVPHMEEVRRVLLEKALAFYQQFVQQRPTDPALRKELARASHRLGDIYRMLGRNAEARQAYDEAIRLCEKLLNDYPNPADSRDYQHHLALTHNDLGELLRTTSDPTGEAESHYRKALDLQSRLVSDFAEEPSYRQELARTHNNHGILLANTNQPNEAERAYTASIGLLLNLAQGPRSQLVYQADLARGYLNRANLYQHQKRAADAEKDYGEAMGLLQQLVRQSPTTASYRHKLGIVHVNRGNLMLQTPSRRRAAEAEYARALEIFKDLAAEFRKVPLYQWELGNADNSLGVCLGFLGEYREGMIYCTQAEQIFAKLVQEDGASHKSRSLLAAALENRGWLLLEQNERKTTVRYLLVVLEAPAPAGQAFAGAVCSAQSVAELVEARRCLQQAIEQQRQALKGNPENPMYHRFFRSQCKNLARALQRLGDHAAAATVAAQLPQAFPPRTREADRQDAYYLAASALAGCVPLAKADERLTEAKRRALAESYAEQAVRYLEGAIDRGLIPGNHLTQDRTLDPLRGRDDFQDLLKRVPVGPAQSSGSVLSR